MNARILIVVALVVGLEVPVARVWGNVNLELRTVQATVEVGEVLEIGLYAVSDDETDQIVCGMNVILQWASLALELDPEQPLVDNGPYDWLLSGFYNDSEMDGLNDTWDDGDAYYQAEAGFTTPALATPEGLLVTTFRFNALYHTPATEVTIPPALGEYTTTQVFGAVPGQDVVGALGSVVVMVDMAHWGTLALDDSYSMCGVYPGDTVIVLLTVSDLAEPINGVQSLISFDNDFLSVVSVAPGDGNGSPWDSAEEVYEWVDGGTLTYGVVLLANGSDQDAVVARIEFLFEPDHTPAAAAVQLLPEVPPLVTKFTQYPDSFPVLPQLGPAVVIAVPGDMDADGDIDLADYAGFARCLSGPGGGYAAPECCKVDFDLDVDVDLGDFAEFMSVFAP